MKKTDINLYEEAFKRGIIIKKDYLMVVDGSVYDLEGVGLDSYKVYHHEDKSRMVGYFVVEGYDSIRVHFNTNMGINSILKYINKIYFDLGFLNKDNDFNNVLDFCYLLSSVMLSNYNVNIDKDYISHVLTMGHETTEEDFSFNEKGRKFFFTDQNLSGEDRQKIALISTNRNRRVTTRAKIEEALEYFILGDKYITRDDIASYINITTRNLRMNLTPLDKKRIEQRNEEITGSPTRNEYIKTRNEDLVINSYRDLLDKGLKPNSINISKHIKDNYENEKLSRISVSKILKKDKVIKRLKDDKPIDLKM